MTVALTHTYEISRSDVFVGHLTAIRHSRLLVLISLSIPAFAGVLSLVGTSGEGFPLVPRLLLAAIWVVLSLVLFCIVQITIVAVMVCFRTLEGVVGMHTLAIVEDGLIERTDYNESLHRWKGVHRVRETSRYFYLYVSEVLYHQVPKRSFASSEQARRFVDEIHARANAARQSV